MGGGFPQGLYGVTEHPPNEPQEAVPVPPAGEPKLDAGSAEPGNTTPFPSSGKSLFGPRERRAKGSRRNGHDI